MLTMILLVVVVVTTMMRVSQESWRRGSAFGRYARGVVAHGSRCRM